MRRSGPRRDQLLLRLGAAKKEAGGAARFVQVQVPPEGQLAALQIRLLRMARALLDPQINLGRMTPEQAKAFLMKEVVLSEPFAQSEVDRYSYRMPGQATSYYYGYVKLEALKTLAEIALGERFELQAFNDFVIAQGILPPNLMKQAVMEEFIPAQKAKLAPSITTLARAEGLEAHARSVEVRARA